MRPVPSLLQLAIRGPMGVMFQMCGNVRQAGISGARPLIPGRGAKAHYEVVRNDKSEIATDSHDAEPALHR